MKRKSWLRRNLWVIFLIVVTSTVIIDVVTKIIFTDKSFVLINGLLSVEYVRNFGAAFSILSGAGILLILLTGTIILIALIGYFTLFFFEGRKDNTVIGLKTDSSIKITQSVFATVAIALFIGGALGNFVDRVFLGYVRDFIKFDFINFPVFNIADIFLNIAMIMMFVYIIFLYKPKGGEDGKRE